MKRGKRYLESQKLIEKGTSYEPKAALDLINQVRTHLLARNYESFLKQ